MLYFSTLFLLLSAVFYRVYRVKLQNVLLVYRVKLQNVLLVYMCMCKPYADTITENAMHTKTLEHNVLATLLKLVLLLCYY